MNEFLLHVSIKISGEIDLDRLKQTFDKALDWANYMPGCWIVYTNSTAEKWYQRLKPILNDSCIVFVHKMDINEKQGFLPEWVWDWIRNLPLNNNPPDPHHSYPGTSQGDPPRHSGKGSNFREGVRDTR